MSETFLSNIDKKKVDSIMQETETNSEYFQKITFSVADSYTQELDRIMKEIYDNIISVDQPALNTLEKYFLELSNCLYFTGEQLEKLGVYDVLSKNAYKEIYNNAYLNLTDIGDAKKKPTVAELTANAESEAQYESIVSDIYSKAYTVVKNKTASAVTMLNSISKIISKRMTEMQLNSINPSGKQILNENQSYNNISNPSYPYNPFSYTVKDLL